MGLAGAVVGVLAEDDDADLIQRRAVQRVEAVAAGRVDDFARLFFARQEAGELLQVGLLELAGQMGIPAAGGLEVAGEYLSGCHAVRFPVSPC